MTEILPELLDGLDAHRLTATFCVEGLNCELYPEALREIAARGHGLGVHGWRHEAWQELSGDPARERALLTRAGDAFRAIGLAPRGFRPPGGGVTAHTEDLLAALGYAWWSLSASDPAPPPGPHRLADVTYRWPLVDAFGLMESFAGMRERAGENSTPLGAAQLGDRFAHRLAHGTGIDVIILHPFLMLDPAWLAQVARLLGLLGEMERSRPGTVVGADALVDGAGR